MVKPQMTDEQAVRILSDLYGVKVNHLKGMCSYDDLNFHVTVDKDHINPNLKELWPHGYTLKIVNSDDTEVTELLESFQKTLLHLKSEGLDVPVPVGSLTGTYCNRIHLPCGASAQKGDEPSTKNIPEGKDGEVRFAVCLYTFVPGQPLSTVQYTPDILRSVGRTLAKVIQAFKSFSNSILEQRSSPWSLWSVQQLRKYVFAVKDTDRQSLVERIIENFSKNVLPAVTSYSQGLIHGDLNEHNLIVSTNVEGQSAAVTGVLDLGDTHRAPRLFEVAICLVYPMIGGTERLGTELDPLLAPGYVLCGLAETLQLTCEERTLLKFCMEARLAQSLTMGAHSNLTNPGNDYVLDSSRHGWTVLQRLVESDPQDLLQKWDEMLPNNNRIL